MTRIISRHKSRESGVSLSAAGEYLEVSEVFVFAVQIRDGAEQRTGLILREDAAVVHLHYIAVENKLFQQFPVVSGESVKPHMTKVTCFLVPV